jgi:hypothetical protein
LNSFDASIVGDAVDLLVIFLQDMAMRRRVACAQPRDLMQALATVANHDGLSEARKRVLTNVFSSLIDEYQGALMVSREPKVLGFLIRIASDRNDIGGLERGAAVRCLLRLAKNPCYCRMLAKLPGLLSSLIRYVRTTTGIHYGTAGGNVCSRDEMKKQIFLLAKAL